ncbi:hypothetical protein GCM10010912_48490 [Paenibacillus albidus]|uniref:SLH domain-containing protein n=1 Tax=Paenibacillus albidus TaxID=2041023 RepID=A0A917CT71_9BACL|nr:hypothetical protein GCM10010912_48490 [Paenibacillus albidus]
MEAFADRFFSQPQIQKQLTGAAVVLVKEDRVLFQKGYGYADLAKKTPVDPGKTVFRVASISKSFTATAVMQLAEQGKIDLNGEVGAYLGNLKIPNQTNQRLTMDHLLTHTTGFDYSDPPSSVNRGSNIALSTFVEQYVPNIVRNPGEAYRYDNYAFNLQGYIIEKISGQPFSRYISQHILEPLGMNSSSFSITPEQRAFLATAYTASKEAIPEYGSVPSESPDGGMLSTGGDIAKFMIAHLNGGSAGGARILQEQTVRKMQETRHSIHPGMQGEAYGFETFYQNSYNGQSVIGKAGDLPGYHSWMWLMPEHKIGGFIVVNGDGADVKEAFFKAFMDHFYPKTTVAKSQVKTSSLDLGRLAGIYTDLRIPLWTFRVTIPGDGQLEIKDIGGTHKLREIEPLLFEDELGNKAGFKANASGEIAYLYYNKVDSWAQKRPLPERFSDVDDAQPYGEYIYGVKQLGWLEPAADGRFEPEKPITRAEFIVQVMRGTGITPSKQSPTFSDKVDSSFSGLVQSAMDMGFVQGRGRPEQLLDLNEPITRQEAAMLIWRMAARLQGPVKAQAQLAGETDKWAEESVKYVVSHTLYGPEIVPDRSGAVNYQSKRPMLRQEAAALLDLFIKKLGTS